MDQNTSIIAELRAEQVDQISDNVSRLSYRLASLDASADPYSSPSSPLPRRLQWALERSKELFNKLEPKQLVVILPTIRKLMELLLGRLVVLKERKNKLPVVRFLPCNSDLPSSELNGPVPSEWLAMFVHSDVPSVCIEDHNTCCNVCLEDFEEPALAAEFQVDGGDNETQEDCLPMFQIDGYDATFECPTCRAEIWTSLSISSDQQQTSDDHHNNPPPWHKIDENMLNWAAWFIRDFDEALNSTTRGHPVNINTLAIWSDQTYKRYIYSRMTDSPEGLVDCLIVGPKRAQSIGALVSKGEHGDASRELERFWGFSGLQGAPCLLAVLDKHDRQAECHWVVHRFSLPDGALTTYRFHTELQACPDCRPALWWPAICLAWPDATICPNPGMPTLIHIDQPMELGVDDCCCSWYMGQHPHGFTS
ncbi:hypothetical protein D9758_005782 [Tetrapyrgos nigripes]|uniref:Uncharacterized protein n=1 Tax=Tetrapyrgos nigripes TaxID=182062 RepID=A0A8H5GJQ0_9AGAR|nr:hypothetical protein D9758_005782 [Tetrapyrgos nigripes]